MGGPHKGPKGAGTRISKHQLLANYEDDTVLARLTIHNPASASKRAVLRRECSFLANVTKSSEIQICALEMEVPQMTVTMLRVKETSGTTLGEVGNAGLTGYHLFTTF